MLCVRVFHKKKVVHQETCTQCAWKLNNNYCREALIVKALLMLRALTLSVVILCCSLSLASCHSQCKHMQKTNQKLIAGNYDFGKKKEAKKFKRKNRKGY